MIPLSQCHFVRESVTEIVLFIFVFIQSTSRNPLVNGKILFCECDPSVLFAIDSKME